ncbi:MAG: hypothetical protein AB7G48_10920 [Nitrospiraceae bacterium]
MPANMILRIKLGPFVSFEIEGANCEEIAQALKGFEKLNQRVDAMCSDLVGRIYPDGIHAAAANQQEEQQ